MAAPIPPSDVAGGSTATSAWANAVSDAIQQLIADLYPAGALAMAWANVTGKPSTFAPTVHAHAGSASGGTVGYADITGKPTSMAPTAHTHPYGSDVTGKPATFAPSDHADAHKTGGGDALVASQINGWNRAAAGSTLGVRIFCGTGTPAGMAEGDIWVIG